MPLDTPVNTIRSAARTHGVMVEPTDYFEGHPNAMRVYEAVRAAIEQLGVPFEVRTSKSQVAFRRRIGFAYLWLPGRYLRNPGSEVVLSIALGRRDESPRWKEVVHPAKAHWMHHLEVSALEEIDGVVVEWLREAADHAA